MRLLIITNDSTVFLSDKAKAERMFGGRVTEVRDLMQKLREQHEVVFGLISGRYGFITGDETIERYDDVPDDKKGYLELQERTDYSGSIKGMAERFEGVMVFVPKEMIRILVEKDALNGNVVSSTSLVFKDHFDRMGWHFFERRGARIGKRNAEAIRKIFSSSSL